jgi:hypothetical protein
MLFHDMLKYIPFGMGIRWFSFREENFAPDNCSIGQIILRPKIASSHNWDLVMACE